MPNQRDPWKRPDGPGKECPGRDAGTLRPAFSLLESLLALSLFFFAALAALEFLGAARTAFFKLKDAEEASLAAASALQKIRLDLAGAGRGLAAAADAVPPLTLDSGVLEIASVEAEYGLAADVAPGDTDIRLSTSAAWRPNREICLVERTRAELRTLAAADGAAAVLSDPAEGGYAAGPARVLLIERIAFFLDPDGRTLRRRVNATSAQPLLEDVRSAVFDYDPASNLVALDLAMDAPGVKTHGLFYFPKNVRLAARRP